MLIDESHNLRNREGKRYRAIQEYIEENESKVHPAVGHALQQDLPRPVQLSSGCSCPKTRTSASGRSNCSARSARRNSSAATSARPSSLAAFEKSDYADDWRDLMRLYLVRRTRSFIQDNYAADRSATRPEISDVRGRHPRPTSRTVMPKTVKFTIDEHDPDDQYARLYAPRSSDTINGFTSAPLRAGQLRRSQAQPTTDDAEADSGRPLPRR